MSGRVRQLGRRAGWGIADQALSSLTNFAVGVFVAREVGPAEFGAFSLAFATYLFVLNASRGLATDPLVVRFSHVDPDRWRAAAKASTGMAMLVGLIAGAACLFASPVLGGATGTAFLTLGIMLPGLMLQDGWRYVFFANGRGRAAFVNDLVWAVCLAPLLAAVVAVGALHVKWFVLAWGGAATVAAVAGMVQARLAPGLLHAGSWLRTHRDLAIRYLSENIAYSAASQFRLYGIGVIAGLAAVGALRASELLLGPVNLIIMGVGNLMAVPEAARIAQRDVHGLRPFIIQLAVLLSGCALAFGLVVGVVMPEALGQRLLGATWPPAEALLVPTTCTIALLGVWAAAWSGMRALGAARRGLRAQVVGASAFFTGSVAGGAIAGAIGAAWGSAAGNLVAAVVWWYQFHAAIHEFRSPPVTESVDDASRV